eukprot:SAG31_NODE_34295_length_334_cov_1.102128_1_plen_102_part_01
MCCRLLQVKEKWQIVKHSPQKHLACNDNRIWAVDRFSVISTALVSSDPTEMQWDQVEGPPGKEGGKGPKAARIECSSEHVYVSTTKSTGNQVYRLDVDSTNG